MSTHELQLAENDNTDSVTEKYSKSTLFHRPTCGQSNLSVHTGGIVDSKL